MAMYDFAGNSDGDLSFQQGDYILVSRNIDAEWSWGRLNGREGMFPRVFVESCTGIVFNTAPMFTGRLLVYVAAIIPNIIVQIL